jgi:hypothetical protein
MKKFFIATSLLALTGWGVLPVGAEPAMIPISYYDDQRQVMVEEKTLNAYHDEMAKFYQDSADLRHDIWEKTHLFARMLTYPDTTKAEVLTIQQEIQVLTSELQREELSFRWDLNSQFPELATDKYRGCLGAATGSIGPGR